MSHKQVASSKAFSIKSESYLKVIHTKIKSKTVVRLYFVENSSEKSRKMFKKTPVMKNVFSYKPFNLPQKNSIADTFL